MEYLDFATDLAYKAGAILRENFVIGMVKDWKEDNSPVTVTDIAVNRMVIEAVEAAYPEHAVLGEEESSLKEGAEYVWICDPVDGTIPFSHGIPTNVFALALVKDGVPIVGVIYDPYLDRLFAAEQGKGATLNGDPIRVSDRSDLKKGVVGMGGGPTMDVGLLSNEFRKLATKPIALYSTFYMGMLVAAGELVANIFGGVTAHDAAALVVIVREAGGTVTDVNGNDQRYDQPINGCIASNGKVHDELIRMLQENINAKAVR